MPEIARFVSGRIESSATCAQPLLRSRRFKEKMFGSSRGEDTIAKISPLRGSIATKAPFAESGIAASAAFCSFKSIVETMWSPGSGAIKPPTSVSVRTSRPEAFTSTSLSPFLPRNSLSYSCSNPFCPTRSPCEYDAYSGSFSCSSEISLV